MAGDASGMKNVVDLDTGMPGLVPGGLQDGTSIYKNYVVKYYKGSLDDLECKMVIEEIESKALLADEIVLLDTKMSFFQDICTVVLKYLEKKPGVPKNV